MPEDLLIEEIKSTHNKLNQSNLIMKKTILTSMLIASLLFAIACKKDDPAKTKTDLLTAKTWTFSKAEFSYSGTTSDAPSDFIGDCAKDNTVVFSRAGSFVFNAGTNTCSGSESNGNGSWILKDSETTLVIDSKSYKLTSVNDTTLKIMANESYDVNGDGTVSPTEKVDVIYTYTGI